MISINDTTFNDHFYVENDDWETRDFTLVIFRDRTGVGHFIKMRTCKPA